MNPIWIILLTLISVAFLFLVWKWVGSVLILNYFHSPWVFSNRAERIFLLLCGPTGWTILRGIRMAKQQGDVMRSMLEEEDEAEEYQHPNL